VIAWAPTTTAGPWSGWTVCRSVCQSFPTLGDQSECAFSHAERHAADGLSRPTERHGQIAGLSPVALFKGVHGADRF
jgi:hypothetical protein